MSIEVVILCDACGLAIDGGKTATAVRKAIKETGGRVNLPGGKDMCPWCARPPVTSEVTDGR
jgi:hypothetical protein